MMDYFVHPQGICDSRNIGPGTRIWAFSHILQGAVIGRDCNIGEHTFIENDVVLGDRVTIKGGVQLWDGVRIESDVFVGPNVTFTNDRFPRSKVYPEKFLQTEVCRKASIGANATILPGIIIGQNAMVGAGAVVTRTVPPNAIVVGNPARIVSYCDSVGTEKPDKDVQQLAQDTYKVRETSVKGVTLHYFPLFKDLRGDLSAGEFAKDIPFPPKRYFLIFDVSNIEVRGEHAHRVCHQFLICVKGSCAIVADDGKNREEFLLNSPNVGLYLPPMVWGIQYKYSNDAVLLVFASEPYDPNDYIRDYQTFLNELDLGVL
jgi:acetyltransferase-like isoleucine patch superfamily enzyme/dTDP-4-dehydrorhamnose 3,5-epimerase-like enzyme